MKNVLEVTQKKATTVEHRSAFQEAVRVFGIARNKKGKRAEDAALFLESLKRELLNRCGQIVIRSTHLYWPQEYFIAMGPRFMQPPSGTKSLMLRWKIGNTQQLPFSCLELRDANDVFMPWTTIHTKNDGFRKCEMSFSSYSSLIVKTYNSG